MFQIQQITSDPAQQQTLVLPDGTDLTYILQFVPMQYGWFFSSLVYGSFTITNIRIVNSPNMLHQYRNQIPFGINCNSVAQREPSQQDDFLSGASKLYVLTQAEVNAYAEFLSGGG